MMRYYNHYIHKGRLESLRLKKLKAEKIIRNALRGAANPINLEEIKALQTDGVLEIQTLYDNIGALFPFILGKVSEGLSITKIERLIGMRDRAFEAILYRYPRLNEEINKARKVRTDSNSPIIDIFT